MQAGAGAIEIDPRKGMRPFVRAEPGERVGGQAVAELLRRLVGGDGVEVEGGGCGGAKRQQGKTKGKHGGSR